MTHTVKVIFDANLLLSMLNFVGTIFFAKPHKANQLPPRPLRPPPLSHLRSPGHKGYLHMYMYMYIYVYMYMCI